MAGVVPSGVLARIVRWLIQRAIGTVRVGFVVKCLRPIRAERFRTVTAWTVWWRSRRWRRWTSSRVLRWLSTVVLRAVLRRGLTGRRILVHGVSFWWLGTQVFHDSVVVRFRGNFVNKLGVGDFALGIDDNHRASLQSGHRAVFELHPVVLAEARPESRGGVRSLDA